MTRLKRIFGGGLFVASILGIIGTFIAIVLVVRASGQLQQEAVATIDLTLDLLATTEASLDLLDDTLTDTADAVDALSLTTDSVGGTVSGTDDLLGSLALLFAEDLPTVIAGTQGSVAAASESAALLEGFLLTLSSVPFIGVNYNPEVSLTQSIEDIETSLDALPTSFDTIASDLNATQASLSGVERGLDDLTGELENIAAALRESQALIADYSLLLDDVIERMETLRETAPRRIRNATVLLVSVLVWLLIAQTGLLYQGREMVTQDYAALQARTIALEDRLNDLEEALGRKG